MHLIAMDGSSMLRQGPLGPESVLGVHMAPCLKYSGDQKVLTERCMVRTGLPERELLG